MGLVVALKFNDHSGAVLADEGTWNLRFRNKAYVDRIHNLMDEDIARKLGIEVAYAGAGFPSLHTEVIQKTRERIRYLWNNKGKKSIPNPPFKTVEDISKIALESLHQVIRRRIDLRLKFYFGFDSTDFIQGSFQTNGEKIDINQESIKSKAEKIAIGEEGGRLAKAWFKSRAMTFGYDPERGVTGYYLDPEKFVMCFNYEGWEAFGSGKYASGVVLAKYINGKPLDLRKNGYPPTEGLITTIQAAQDAMATFQETGGNINIVLIHGESSEMRYVEIFDDRSRLAGEIVKALNHQFITKKKAETLIQNLIFQNANTAKIEKDLIKSISDPAGFQLLLRGYKLDEIPVLTDLKETPTRSK